MSYSHYDFVRVFKNDSNLGMDKNFEKTAKLCNGKFVWFFGQDDQLYPGSIEKVVKIIRNNKNLGIVYLNYDQYDNNLEKILNKSYLVPLWKN